MSIKRAICASLLMATIAVLVSGCMDSGPPAGQAQENQQQNNITKSLVNNQPIPSANYSQARQTLIEIEKAQINGVQTTSFFFNQGVTDPIKVCLSIGMPIPNTASLSNPIQKIDGSGSNGGGNVTVAQMDPNGIYVPSASTGTYVMCVGADGKPFASYWEGYVETEFAPAKWDREQHMVVDIGPPSFSFSKSK